MYYLSLINIRYCPKQDKFICVNRKITYLTHNAKLCVKDWLDKIFYEIGEKKMNKSEKEINFRGSSQNPVA
jgi:hypothetical protein